MNGSVPDGSSCWNLLHFAVPALFGWSQSPPPPACPWGKPLVQGELWVPWRAGEGVAAPGTPEGRDKGELRSKAPWSLGSQVLLTPQYISFSANFVTFRGVPGSVYLPQT